MWLQLVGLGCDLPWKGALNHRIKINVYSHSVILCVSQDFGVGLAYYLDRRRQSFNLLL